MPLLRQSSKFSINFPILVLRLRISEFLPPLSSSMFVVVRQNENMLVTKRAKQVQLLVSRK
jgi:hypothetical protein